MIFDHMRWILLYGDPLCVVYDCLYRINGNRDISDLSVATLVSLIVTLCGAYTDLLTTPVVITNCTQEKADNRTYYGLLLDQDTAHYVYYNGTYKTDVVFDFDLFEMSVNGEVHVEGVLVKFYDIMTQVLADLKGGSAVLLQQSQVVA